MEKNQYQLIKSFMPPLNKRSKQDQRYGPVPMPRANLCVNINQKEENTSASLEVWTDGSKKNGLMYVRGTYMGITGSAVVPKVQGKGIHIVVHQNV
jgi:hypothetical protein